MPAKPSSVTTLNTDSSIKPVANWKAGAKRPVVVVLGMHRSGTSVLTRALSALGVELGASLMKPAEQNNAKGFWEDLDIFELNQSLLTKCHSTWHSLALVEEGRFETAEFSRERVEAANLLSAKIHGRDIFAFKDPRTTILLPFWRCVFSDLDLEPQFVIAIRNPLEIAESLRKRDGFDRTKSLILWLKHMYSAVHLTVGARRIFVGYQQIVADPQQQLSRLSNALDLRMPPVESELYRAFSDEFLDASLNHNLISPNELSRCEDIPDVITAFYRMLSEWTEVEGEACFEIPDELLVQIEGYLSRSQHLFAYCDRVELEVSTLKKHIMTMEAQVKAVDAVREELSASQLRLAVVEKEVAAELAAKENSIKQLETAKLAATNREREAAAKLAANEGVLLEMNGRLDELKRNASIREAELQTALAAHQKNASEMRTELRLQRASILALRKSTSWRLTRPVRALKHLVTNPGDVARRLRRRDH